MKNSVIGKDIKINRDDKGRFASDGVGWRTKLVVFMFIVAGALFGVAKLIDWSATHQIQRPWAYVQKDSLFNGVEKRPLIIEVEPETIIISPVIAEDPKEFTTIENKIVDTWGYKDGVIGMAIAECESGRYTEDDKKLNPEVEVGELRTDQVSFTGDLGLFQINWYWNGDIIQERLGYTPADMFDVDKNIEAAHLVWDRTDGTEGDGKGSWGDGVSTGWTTFNTGVYLQCLGK